MFMFVLHETIAFTMTAEFIPDHSLELPLNELTHEEFLVIATETARSLSWNITYLTHKGFIAYARPFSEEIRLTIDGNGGLIQSRYPLGQVQERDLHGRTIHSFINLFSQFAQEITPEEIAKKYKEIKGSFSVEKEDDALNTGSAGESLSLFIPGKEYFVTPILIYINVLIFILMIFSGVGVMEPEGQDLIKWGANFRPLTLNGQWWRLISCCFIHIGAVHLLMNMYALMYIGLLLEPHLGRLKFLAAYLLTGIAASTVSLLWHDHTISAGASGAIFGMYGVFLAMLTTNLIEKSARKPLLASIVVFVLWNLANGMKGGIDNAAHIGGLVSGLLMGYAFYPLLKNQSKIVQ
jgi:rhomboid protease GluP